MRCAKGDCKWRRFVRVKINQLWVESDRSEFGTGEKKIKGKFVNKYFKL